MDISEVTPEQGPIAVEISAPAAFAISPAIAPDFRLERMVLIDSYAPGGEVIINLSEGAIITGENGAGKTSLIRLVPIFFGENPADVSVGTDRFSDFYLVRTTSYIIFEYRRRDMRCLAVLYANSEGTFTYRFIRTGYDLSLFAEADGKTLIQNHALSTHLKTLGVIHSRALAKSEYQAVIQGRLTSGSGKDANNQRGMILDYAFTAGNQRLDHIDKIIGSMFRRQADFKDFLRMTVAYIAPEGKDIALLGDRSRVEEWPAHYAAYQDIMRHSGRMDELTSLGAKLKANEAALSDLHARLLLSRDHFTDQAKRLDGAHQESNEKLAQLEAAYLEATETLRGKAAKAAADAKILEDLIASLNEQNQAFTDDDIEQKAAVVNDLGEQRKKKARLEERKNVLTGAQGEIESRFGQLKLKIEGDYLQQVETATRNKESIDESYAPRAKALAEAHQEANDQLRAKAESNRETAQGQLNEAIRDKATLEAAVANPAADPELVAAAEDKREREELASAAYGKAAGETREADRARIEAREAYEKHEAGPVAACTRVIAEERSTAKDLLATANPDSASLLSFLREHRPGWTADIAKIIDPALLHRTDLAPTPTGQESEGVFGLTLDLSRIHAPLFADEAALQAKIAASEQRLVALEEAQKAVDAELKRLNGVRNDKAEAHALHLSEELKAKQALESATTERKLAESQVRDSKAAAQEAAKEALVTAERQLKACEETIRNLQKNLRTALGAEAQRHSEAVAALDGVRKDEIKVITDKLAAAKKETDVQLQGVERDRLAALAKQGVDTKAVEEIDRELLACTRAIANGETWTEQVFKWKLWRETQWAKLATHQEEAQKLRHQEAVASRKLETANESWTKTRKEKIRELSAIADNANEARELARQADIHLQSVNDYPASPTILAGKYELVWTVDAMGRSKLALVSEHGQLMTEIRSRVREIKNAFRKGTGTPVEHFFETLESQIDPEDDNPAIWIEPLRQWYGSRHEEFLRTLLLEAQSFGRIIHRFHADIVDFDRKVADFNRDIRTALNKTLHFPRIANIDITFASTIEKKAYWQPIETFVQKHKAWVNGVGQNLPDPSFSDDLRSLMAHWEIKSGIRADRLELIDVRGEVVENGKKKAFTDAKALHDLSSNGLSYLILTTISVAFLHMIRGKAKAHLTLAVDELLDLDVRNIGILVQMLRDNGIDLVSACPDADVDVMVNFQNRYRVDRDEMGPCLLEADLDDEELLYV